MFRKKSLYLALALVLFMAGIATAHHHKRKAAETCNKGMGFCFLDCKKLSGPKQALKNQEELALTDAQVSKLKELCLAAKKKKIRLKADIKISKLELNDLLGKKDVDTKAVDAKIDEIAKLMADFNKNCVQAKLAARDMLTTEQLTKLKNIVKACQAATAESESGKLQCERKSEAEATKRCQQKKQAD